MELDHRDSIIFIEVMQPVRVVLIVVFGYLMGSILFADIIARLRGVNIWKVGSGNPGAANVFREVGKLEGIIVWVLDAAKAAIPMLIADRVLRLPYFWVGMTGIAAFVGHCWPIWYKLKGGIGAATASGVFLYLLPRVFPFGVAAFFILQRVGPRSGKKMLITFVVMMAIIFGLYYREWRWLLPFILIFMVIGFVANIDVLREVRL